MSNQIDLPKARRMLSECQRDLPLMQAEQFVSLRVLHGEIFLLGDDDYFDLRKTVAEFFKVHPLEVVIVGSAKLGFTLVDKYDKDTKQLVRSRFDLFNEKSDIDIAIVSSKIFDEFWIDIHEYMSQAYMSPQGNMTNLFFNGWIRPDKMPFEFPGRNKWFDFFEKLRSDRRFGGYKLSAGVYKSWYFLEKYQLRAIKNIKAGVK